VFLAAAQSLGVSYFLENIKGQSTGIDAVIDPGWGFRLLTVVTITTGTIFIMWLGEQITERGIGNGISLIIFVGIISELPFAVKSEWNHYLINRGFTKSLIEELFLVVLMVVVVAAVVLMTQGQRRIPVQYAKRVVGRRVYGGQSTHIPLRINAAGVIPIIFAQSIMFLPGTITQFFSDSEVMQIIGTYFTTSSMVYWAFYGTMIVFFTYFYTAIVMDPQQLADNMKRHGGRVYPRCSSGQAYSRVYRRDHDPHHPAGVFGIGWGSYLSLLRYQPVQCDAFIFAVFRWRWIADYRRSRVRYAAAGGIPTDDAAL